MGFFSKNYVGRIKPNSLCISLIFIIICFVPKFEATESEPGVICSVKEPKSSQVCISIKFPWTIEPVFFCTDQNNIRYVPQCTGAGETDHCPDDGRNDSLKIATLWDCCSLLSLPNPCEGVECPPAPFNRTCKAIKTQGECCPSYFCDSGEPNNCKAKRLKLSCINPPKGKENCTAFKDPYGCCNSYQCPQDEKPGVCPRYLREGRHINTDDSNQGFWKRTATVIVNSAKETVKKVVTKVKTTIEKHGGEFGKSISKSIPIPFQSQPHAHAQSRDGRMLNENSTTLRCSGDWTCPGSMKCCQPVTVNYRLARHEIRRTTIENVNGKTRSSNHETKVFKVQYSHHPDPSRPLDGICYEPEELPPNGVETTSQPSSSYPSSSSSSTTNIPRRVTEQEIPTTSTSIPILDVPTTTASVKETRENNNEPEVAPIISSTPPSKIKATTTPEFITPEKPTTVLTEPVVVDATTIRTVQASSAPLVQDPDSESYPGNTVVQA